MYFGDHVPPDFHAENMQSAQISIRDLGILEGHLPPKALALIVEWASLHQKELMDNRALLSESGNGTFVKIEPLK